MSERGWVWLLQFLRFAFHTLTLSHSHPPPNSSRCQPRHLLFPSADKNEEKITYDPSTSIQNSGTFTFNKEDHTVGNLVRMQLLLDSNVTFAGYMMPHPLENRFIMTVRTASSNIKPTEVLMNAVEDLSNECDYLTENFDRACKEEERKEKEQGADMMAGNDL